MGDKTMVVYQVVKETLRSQEIGTYQTFGVGAYRSCQERLKRVALVSDVFLEQEAAERFVKRCNQLQLDPSHLLDVIEDALSAQ